jgi:23S rRNA (guanosine2251-2'-O)-methyltransferase
MKPPHSSHSGGPGRGGGGRGPSSGPPGGRSGGPPGGRSGGGPPGSGRSGFGGRPGQGQHGPDRSASGQHGPNRGAPDQRAQDQRGQDHRGQDHRGQDRDKHGQSGQGPRPPGQGHSGQSRYGQGQGSSGQGQRGEQAALHQQRPPFRGNPQQGRRDHGGAAGGQRAPEPPRGTVWLYGLHAAGAALVNPNRRLRRLLLTEEAEAALAERCPPPWPVPSERIERARLDQLLGRDIVHQGVALLADLLAPAGLAQTLQRPGPILVLDQVTDPRNVGAILRSAAAFGVAGVITQDRNAPEETGALAKAASGALETMPLLRAVNIARTLVALKAANCWVLGLDGAATAPLSGPALADRRIALVLGAEGSGLRRLTRDTCDAVVGLATTGAMESLNVSAAAAIALYELTRRA